MSELITQESYRRDTHLIRLIKNGEFPLIFILWCILKVLNVFANDFAVGDQIAMSINHVGNHHDLIRELVREFEWLFRRLNVVCHDDRFGSLHSRGEAGKARVACFRLDGVPKSDPDVCECRGGSQLHCGAMDNISPDVPRSMATR